MTLRDLGPLFRAPPQAPILRAVPAEDRKLSGFHRLIPKAARLYIARSRSRRGLPPIRVTVPLVPSPCPIWPWPRLH